jgi:Thioesterase-like superfamily
MSTAHPWPPAYFHRTEGGFIPTKLARNPWFEGAIAGGPTAALFGVFIEEAGLDPSLSIARISIDILGKVPSALLRGRVIPVREGRQMQLHRIEMCHDDRVVAQAHLLRVRHLETPGFGVPFDFPDPDTLEESPYLVGASMAGAIRTKAVRGGVREAGPGTLWLTMDGEVIAGEAPSPFLKACLFSDFGNGVGSATQAQDFSFANLDINVQFLRMPVGEWFLLDAHTVAGGLGHGVARNTLGDRDGVFAIGTQTVFMDPPNDKSRFRP